MAADSNTGPNLSKKIVLRLTPRFIYRNIQQSNCWLSLNKLVLI